MERASCEGLSLRGQRVCGQNYSDVNKPQCLDFNPSRQNERYLYRPESVPLSATALSHISCHFSKKYLNQLNIKFAVQGFIIVFVQARLPAIEVDNVPNLLFSGLK